MLVINANNQQDTTNYMLAEPWYPDLNSILMFGSPTKVATSGASWVNWSAGWITWGPSIFNTLETAWTDRINYFCPKINKEALYSWNQLRNPITNLSAYTYMPDVWYVWTATALGWYPKKLSIQYNIAVKGLMAWQIVWEKIIVPLYIGNLTKWGTDATLWYFTDTDYYWYNATYWPVFVKFWLYNPTDGKRDITTVKLNVLNGQSNTSYSENIQYVSLSWTSDTKSMNCILWNQPAMWTYRFYWTYSGSWIATKDDDILIAQVNANLCYRIPSSGNAANCQMSMWIFAGWTNNNSMRDIYWFRPFQVSIRDA